MFFTVITWWNIKYPLEYHVEDRAKSHVEDIPMEHDISFKISLLGFLNWNNLNPVYEMQWHITSIITEGMDESAPKCQPLEAEGVAGGGRHAACSPNTDSERLPPPHPGSASGETSYWWHGRTSGCSCLPHPWTCYILAGQGDKAPVLQLHLPFLAHCLISGYRIGIGDQIDLLIILPDCHCHTPLGPKHIISSLHHLQCDIICFT